VRGVVVAVMFLARVAAARAADGARAGGAPATPPDTVVICQETTARRCWIAFDAKGCGAPPATVFRVVPGEAGRPEMADALADCRDALKP
jgi:hypothetical protein